MKNLRANEKDYSIFLKADIAFHNCISEATGNVVLCEMTKLILDKLVAHHSNLKTRRLSAHYREVSVSTATKVVEGIENQDEKNASIWMERHLDAITKELKHIID